jgi:hypothetical protein
VSDDAGADDKEKLGTVHQDMAGNWFCVHDCNWQVLLMIPSSSFNEVHFRRFAGTYIKV